MSVTDIVIDTGGVVRIVDRDLHLNILMRLHDSLTPLRVTVLSRLLTVDPNVGSADGCVSIVSLIVA